jgi:hypothetical protein
MQDPGLSFIYSLFSFAVIILGLAVLGAAMLIH